MPAILHADVDGFFIQVEQQKHSHLRNKAVALQQHGDIIAANTAAKAAGVKKHCSPETARALLKRVNGVVAYVHVEEGGRISYKPYREVSTKFFAMLSSLELASVVEKGSIDEAFILCSTSGSTAATGSATSMHGSSASISTAFLDAHSLQVATSLAETIRQRAWKSLGMRVSVGVAHNKLLAKLASAAAKPDGVHAVAGESAAAELLRKAPVSRLPGFGGKVAQALAAHSIHSAQQVSSMKLSALRTLCSTLTEQSAQKLLEYSCGIDHSLPQVRLPPKALTLQMSLTPIPTALPPAARGAEPAGGGKKDGMLRPLHMHAYDAPARMQSLVGVMIGDLLGRVWHDGEVQGRWPTALTLKLRTHGSSGQFLSRLDRFPPYADLSPWAQLGGGSLPPPTLPAAAGAGGEEDRPPTSETAAHMQPTAPQPLGGTETEPPQEGGILGAAVKTALGMFQDMRRAHAADLPVVEVHIAAAKFQSIASAKMKPLSLLFATGHVQCGGKPAAGNPLTGQGTGSENPRGVKRKSTATHSGDGAGSPRLWPTVSDATPNDTGHEQQSSRPECGIEGVIGWNFADAGAVDVDDSTIVDKIDSADNGEQGCVGFGSPISGLIRADSGPSSSQEGTARQNPRHSETQSVVVVGSSSGAWGPGNLVCLERSREQRLHVMASGSQIDCSNSDDDGGNSGGDVTEFDRSAQQTLDPVHKAQAPNNNDSFEAARTSIQVGVKGVDFADLLGAWERKELDGDDARTVADAIMRGLRRSS